MDKDLVVQIRRSGGITGISKTGNLQLSFPTHGTADDYWCQLAVGVREELRSMPQESTVSLTRDSFIWSLSFDTENFVVPESQLSNAAKTLAEHVLQLASIKPPDPRFGDQ